MSDIQFQCPKKKCTGWVEVTVDNGEGNFEGSCGVCESVIGFHYTIEIEDVRVIDD